MRYSINVLICGLQVILEMTRYHYYYPILDVTDQGFQKEGIVPMYSNELDLKLSFRVHPLLVKFSGKGSRPSHYFRQNFNKLPFHIIRTPYF